MSVVESFLPHLFSCFTLRARVAQLAMEAPIWPPLLWPVSNGVSVSVSVSVGSMRVAQTAKVHLTGFIT